MKKIFITLIVASLAALMGVQAQTVKDGDTFWDGEHLMKAQVHADGIVYLSGCDKKKNCLNYGLHPIDAKNGEYILIQFMGDEAAPYHALYGNRVEYVHKDGMNFLAFYTIEDCVIQTAVLTPDNLNNCIAQQRHVEEESDPVEIVSTFLMNQMYISGLHGEVVQQMIDKLEAKDQWSVIEDYNLMMLGYAQHYKLFAIDNEGDGKIHKAKKALNSTAAIREAYANAKKTIELRKEAELPPNDLVATSNYMAAGAGPTTDVTHYYYSDEYDETLGRYHYDPFFITRKFNVGAMNFYQEFLYDDDGSLIFYYEKQGENETRYYWGTDNFQHEVIKGERLNDEVIASRLSNELINAFNYLMNREF